MAGRRSSGAHAAYNPLADGGLQNTGLESWICCSDDPVNYYRTASLKDWDQVAKSVAPGQVVNATKDGDWLEDKSNGLFLPFQDCSGNRLFKNERLSFMQRVASGECDTDARGGGAYDNPRRNTSGSALETMVRTLSGGSTGATRTSFRWVDGEGISHRLAGDSDLLSDVPLRPEVWICVKQGGVAYRHSPLLDAAAALSLPCGQKVTAVKEDGWLKVFEVKNSTDIVSALEAVGRRSLRSASRVELHDTGLYLPFVQDGERLFKNEKLLLFEKSQNADPSAYSKSEDTGGCAIS